MGYGAETLGSVVHTVEQGFGAIETGLGAVGGISLVVAGLMIGVVTSMAVLQRRREIGILRALGATRTQVAGLFLTEAACIGLGGAVIGVALGDGVGALINSATHPVGGSLFILPAWLVLLGLGIGLVVGLLAALVPASHAANLHPVDALREN